MKKAHIIGLSGKIGSGKTTHALELGKLGYNLARFSAPLKEIVAIVLGTTHTKLSDQQFKNEYFPKFDCTVGELLQWVGTDVFRAINPDVWVDAALSRLLPGQRYVFDDVRFKNEADAIRKMGGIIVRLEGDPSGCRAASNRDLTHISETELDDYSFDHVILTDILPISEVGRYWTIHETR